MKRLQETLFAWICTSVRAGLGSVLDWLVTAGARVSSYAIFVIAILVTFDATRRFVFGIATKWVVEFSAYLLVLVVFFGLAYTLREGSHIRVTFVLERLPEKAQYWLNLITPIMSLSFTTWLGLLTWKSMRSSFAFGATSQILTNVPIWPVQLLIPLGLALISLQLIRDIYTQIRAGLVNRRKSD